MIVGRTKETAELLDAFESLRAEFIVLYGRRRIGKTFLIEALYGKEENTYFLHATGIRKGTMAEQLKTFAQSLSKAFYNGIALAAQNSWLDMLDEVHKTIQQADPKKKIVLFLDELPWLCTNKSRLLEAMDYYWNRYWKNDARIKLVICGSSASWMIRKIINHKGGLHNRQTRQIILKPFTLSETRDFLEASSIYLSPEQIVQIYLFCGGVPYYLSYIQKGKSAAQMMDQLCFNASGILYGEFDKLFDALFDDAEIYKNLIRIISTKREGLSIREIEEENEGISKGGTLSQQLKALEEASFIKSFTPLGHQRQGTYYRVIDEYCYFYLRWIEPARKTLSLDQEDPEYWSSKVGTPEYCQWLGYGFEAICYKHIGEIRRALDIKPGAMIGAWRYAPRKNKENKEERGAQIDLIFDRPDGLITLCEIKYTDAPFEIDQSYFEALTRKREVYKKQTRCNKHLHWVLISAHGLKKNSYSERLIDQVVLLEQLFIENKKTKKIKNNFLN